MRLALLLLAAVAAVVLWRRRGAETSRIVVAWRDGSELELAASAPQHEQLVAVAGRALA